MAALLEGLRLVAGVALIAVASFDFVLTAVTVGGRAGPITLRVANLLHRLLAGSRLRRHPRLGRLVGPGLLLSIFLTWLSSISARVGPGVLHRGGDHAARERRDQPRRPVRVRPGHAARARRRPVTGHRPAVLDRDGGAARAHGRRVRDAVAGLGPARGLRRGHPARGRRQDGRHGHRCAGRPADGLGRGQLREPGPAPAGADHRPGRARPAPPGLPGRSTTTTPTTGARPSGRAWP